MMSWKRALCDCWRTGTPPTWLMICAAIVVQVGFGLYPAIVRKFASNEKANPFVFGFYRDAASVPILAVCAYVAERKILIPNIKTILLFIFLGGVGIFGAQLLYILAIYKVGPDISSAFQPIIPVWTAILAVITCTEKVPHPFLLATWSKLIGIVLAAGGAVEIVLTDRHSMNSSYDVDSGNCSEDLTLTSLKNLYSGIGDQLLGYICLIFNTLGTAVYILMQKKFIFNRPNCKWKDYPVSVTAYSYFFGAVFMAVPPIIIAAKGEKDVFKVPQGAIYALLYAVLINSVFCYMLLTWANMFLSSIIVTALWPLQVLVTGVATFFITGELLAPLQYVGAVMLIIGLMLVLSANYMDERQKKGKGVVRLDTCFHNRTDKLERKPLLGYKSTSSESINAIIN